MIVRKGEIVYLEMFTFLIKWFELNA
jgi:hypothetical protein